MCKVKIRLIFFVLLGLLFIDKLTEGVQIETQSFIQDFQNAKTLGELNRASNIIMQNRQNLISNLIGMLRSNPDKEKMIRICYLLGEYRATEAVTDLVAHIDLEVEIKGELKEPLMWGLYPAQGALIKIGFSVIPQMIQILETNTDDHIQRLSATVIWEIIGRELPTMPERKEIVRIVINNAIKKQSDSLKRKNLENALKLLN